MIITIFAAEEVLDFAIPAPLLDLPPRDVVPDVLLVLVPLKRHVPDGVPRRNLQHNNAN